MCVTCGCSDKDQIAITNPKTGDQKFISHNEAHALGHSHTHGEEHADTPVRHEHLHAHHEHHSQAVSDSGSAAVMARSHNRTIELEKEILGKNQLIAERNREWLTAKGILALNLVSSPGSGKTTLLEQTVLALKDEFEISVTEGDQETIHDAERIRATGGKALQINTGTGCHLEAEMLERGIKSLDPASNSLLFIENVGNLVCPALFDLGERAKVAILSVTEGEDKPLKYPHMFRACELMILNKIDLLPFVRFDVEKCVDYARQVNPEISVIRLSATTGEGCVDWYRWLEEVGSSSPAAKTQRRN
ncbi:MAG: hydrogenase nickel incorporation protein HypB [Acidobacteria bacterium]|nr:hydrogenase nickel incorporation protein HypB [Acidobacteriota bacterium]